MKRVEAGGSGASDRLASSRIAVSVFALYGFQWVLDMEDISIEYVVHVVARTR